jgi:hypothetical protein
MTVEKLITDVGRERFQELAQRAWATAAGTGRSPHNWDEDEELAQADYDIVSDLYEVVFESDIPDMDKIRLLFQLYCKAPKYSWLAGLSMFYLSKLDPQGRKELWSQTRCLLASSDERLSDPLVYWLWCGPFENPKVVKEAWTALTIPCPPDSALERLLGASGPVPYLLKRALYEDLLPRKCLHYFIYRSLLHSAFDFYGKLDYDDAQRILARLKLPEDTEHLGKLAERLSSPLSEP